MLNSLKKIFNQQEKDTKNLDSEEELTLVCGLMIEAAHTDGKIDQSEIEDISDIMINIFKESPDEVEKVMQKSLQEINEPKSLHFFTSKINKVFDNEKKILLIETLWKIVLSDGKIHEYESSLIRRLAGLLYISDVSCGNAKKRALSELQKV